MMLHNLKARVVAIEKISNKWSNLAMVGKKIMRELQFLQKDVVKRPNDFSFSKDFLEVIHDNNRRTTVAHVSLSRRSSEQRLKK